MLGKQSTTRATALVFVGLFIYVPMEDLPSDLRPALSPGGSN